MTTNEPNLHILKNENENNYFVYIKRLEMLFSQFLIRVDIIFSFYTSNNINEAMSDVSNMTISSRS